MLFLKIWIKTNNYEKNNSSTERFTGIGNRLCTANRSYSLKEFDKLRVWGEFKVFLVKGDSLNAKVETQGIPASDIALDVNGNTLEVKLKGKLYDRVSATVYITYRELREISVSAAAAVSLQDTLKVTNISININTSSEFDGAVLAETADLTVGQGSTYA